MLRPPLVRLLLNVVLVWAIAWAPLSVVGCGPISSASAIGDAEEALEAAKQARAHRLVPYDYWMAVLYLEKAKLTDGYSEFEASESFAEQATAFALAAEAGATEEKLRQQILQERLRGNGAPR